MSGLRGNAKVVLIAGVAMSCLSWGAAEADAAAAPTRADQSAQSSSGESQILGEVIVTARKREENVQKVPISVSVQSAITLQQHQIDDLYGLQRVTPSLGSQTSQNAVGASNFSIRGIGTTLSGIQIESSVGLVIDDVPLARAELGNVDFFDLERVEVLNGPQGMLFGKNASAGVINIVTQAPTLGQTQFLAHAEYGNMDTPTSGNTYKLNAAANLPMGDNAALRITGFFSHDDGYIKDVYNNQGLGMSEDGVRAKLLWEPSANLKMLVSADYVHEDGPGESVFAPSYNDPFFTAANAVYGVKASYTNDLTTANGATYNRFDIYGVSWKGDLGLGGGYTLTNILGYRDTRTQQSNDVDLSWVPMVDSDAGLNENQGSNHFWQVTEELRLTSPSAGRLTYQGGFFFLKFGAQGIGAISGPGQDAFLETVYGLPPGVFEPINYPATETVGNTSIAGYFEGQYKLTDSLRFSAGLRYTHDELSYTYLSPAQPAGIFDPEPPTPAGGISNSDTHNDVSYRFSLDYDITPSVMAYLSYAKGYKGPTFDATTTRLVGPEIPTDWELGLKSTVLDNRLRLNVALFHEDFNGFQTQAFTVSPVPSFVTLNAGNLLSEGVEAEFTAIPVEGLTLSGGVTYNYTEYENLTAAPCYYMEPVGTGGTNVCSSPISVTGVQNVSGDQLAGAPRWTETITARYERSIAAQWSGFIQGTGYFRSSFNYSPDEDPNTRVGDTAIFGLSVGAHTADNHLFATFFVRNLTDQRVPSFIVASPAALFDASVFTGSGDYMHQFDADSFRTIGLSLDYRM